MHRDKKLGLALGVLLVGIVAAFFYRNDRAAEPKAPRLENPQSLDDRIAERPNVPYLTGPESDDVVRNTSHGRSTRRESDLEPELGRPTPFGQESHGAADVPDPIPAFSETRLPEGNREWTPVKPERTDRNTRPAPTEREQPVASASGLMHEVRPGETLSGISARYLGNSTRFHEIYEANRDQLRSANDVRVGMKLRIPRKAESTASEHGPARPRTSSDDRTPPARDRRAERDDRDRSGASLLPITSDRETTARSTDDRPGSKPSVPTRTISSSPPDEEDLPFGQPRDSVARDTTPSVDDGGDSSAGRLFRPSRRSPLTPGSKELPAERATGGQRLGQRLPEDLPDLDEPVVKPRPRPAASEPSSASETPRKSASEFLKDAGSSTARAAKPAASASDLAPGRYVVQRGDTLEKIAQRLLGDKSAASKILEANRDLLQSVDDVREGMSLRIPR